VAQDYVKAVRWFRKAAEQGHAQAQSDLGTSYAEGHGVPQDFRESFTWWRKAAAQGNLGAQFNLASRLATGQGAPQDYVEAYKWVSLALAQVKPAALIRCTGGVCGEGAKAPCVYLNGIPVFPGHKALIKTPIGQVEVRCRSVEGTSAKILVEGEARVRTFDIFTSKNQPSGLPQKALDLRAFLESFMTPAQIAEGQHRASSFTATLERGADLQPQPSGGEERAFAGTGFVITDDGYIMTCEHVVRGASAFRVRLSGGFLPAKLIDKDRTIDVAVLKVNGAFVGLPVQPRTEVKLGDPVFTIGFPNPDIQGMEPKLTRGDISSLAGMGDNPRYFQISVPVQPGNSGGALVDENGNVVGVVTARLDDVATYEISGALPQNVNYAVKASLVYNFLKATPDLFGKLKPPHSGKDHEAAIATAERAAVLVIAE
jgi:S1-C subfamily serine protease